MFENSKTLSGPYISACLVNHNSFRIGCGGHAVVMNSLPPAAVAAASTQLARKRNRAVNEGLLFAGRQRKK
jgi:hypothetical protein